MVMETGTKQTKGAPEQILNLCNTRAYLRKRDHLAIDKYALPGLRSLAVVAAQRIAKKTKKCSGGPWEFVGGLPLFDPPRHDSAYTIRRASYLGVNISDHWWSICYYQRDSTYGIKHVSIASKPSEGV